MSRTNCKGCAPASYAPPTTHIKPPSDFASDDAHGKAFATLQARAALAGSSLYELADGAYILTRWGMTRALPDLAAVSALLSHMGVR